MKHDLARARGDCLSRKPEYSDVAKERSWIRVGIESMTSTGSKSPPLMDVQAKPIAEVMRIPSTPQSGNEGKEGGEAHGLVAAF